MSAYPRLIAIALALGCAALGCAAPSMDAQTGMDDLTAGDESLSFESVLPELAAEGITGTVKKLVDPRVAGDPQVEAENRYYLEVAFGTLTEAQFETIKARFGGHSKVPFDAARAYDLTDFLAPAMQAVVNHTYATGSYGGSDLYPYATDELSSDEIFAGLAKNGVAIEANCFNTTTEILRQLRSEGEDAQYLFYIPDREQADGWFSDDAYSTRVSESNRKAGDVLVVKQRQTMMSNTPYLAHTAILLSKELLFEKTNGSDNDPYRISLRKDVLAMYERTLGNDYVLDYRRFGADKKAIPSLSLPTNELGAAHKEVLTKAHAGAHPDNVTLSRDFGFMGGWSMIAQEVQPARIVIDSRTGRGSLEADASVLARFVALQGN